MCPISTGRGRTRRWDALAGTTSEKADMEKYSLAMRRGDLAWLVRQGGIIGFMPITRSTRQSSSHKKIVNILAL
jgi:hypothetical protein